MLSSLRSRIAGIIAQSDLNAAKSELLIRGQALQTPLPTDQDYATTLAILQRSLVELRLQEFDAKDPQIEKKLLVLLKEETNLLRWQPSGGAGNPKTFRDVLNGVWDANERDARCAIDQATIYVSVSRLLQMFISLFFGLLLLQGVSSAILGTLNLMQSKLDPTKGPLGVQIGQVVAASATNFILNSYIGCSLIAMLGATFAVYLEPSINAGAPHWRLVRHYAGKARIWAGAAIGLFTAAIAPILFGNQAAVDAGARVFVAAFLFGLSQELFIKRMRHLGGSEAK